MKTIRLNAAADLLRVFGMKIRGNLVVADTDIEQTAGDDGDGHGKAEDLTKKKSILPGSDTGG